MIKEFIKEFIFHPDIDTQIKANIALLDHRFKKFELKESLDKTDKDLLDRLQIKHGIIVLTRRKLNE